jgi:hypothetical protein
MTKIFKAIYQIKNTNNNRAKLTYQTICKNKINIKYHSKMTDKDLVDYKGWYKSLKNKVKMTPKIRKFIEKREAGFICHSGIFINKNMSINNIAIVIVHEIDHYINESNKANYNKHNIILDHELKAYLAELEFKNIELTDNIIQETRTKVIKDYTLKIN